MTKLTKQARELAIELCGNIDLAIELLTSKKIGAEYWQGIRDAINACNRITRKRA